MSTLSRKKGFHFQEVPVDSMDSEPWPRLTKPSNIDGMSGNLKIKTKGFFAKWRTFYFVVQNGELCYFSNTMDAARNSPVGKISIQDSQVVVVAAENLTGKPNSFLLHFPLQRSSVYLCAPSESEMSSWMSTINSLSLKNNAAQSYSIEGIHNYVEAISDAAVMSDAKGTIVAWNRAACNLFGWSAEEAKGRNVNILIPNRWHAVHDSCVLRYQYTGERRLIGVPRKLEAVRKDGSSITIEISLGEVPGASSHTDTAPDPNAPRWMALFRELSASERSMTESAESQSDFADDKSTTSTISTISEAPHPLPPSHPPTQQQSKCPFHSRTISTAPSVSPKPASEPKCDSPGSDQSSESMSSRSSTSSGEIPFTDVMRKSVNDLANNIINALLSNVQELQDRYDDLQQRHDFLRYENQRLLQLVVESQEDRQRLEKEVREFKLQLESSHVEQVLHDSDGYAALLEFARREHAEENLLFWKAVESYRQTQFASDLPQVARVMYTWYIQQGAPRDLNIRNETREEIGNIINACDSVPLTRRLFDSVQRSIFHIIRDDIWTRFIQTEDGRKFLNSISLTS